MTGMTEILIVCRSMLWWRSWREICWRWFYRVRMEESL